mmetsp:Transcript_174414/g.559105  ORF Transcript_174414/g.559105 Transcript_174414/m.559105 type:complete len:333 (-) Transcript_174414:713-1711(-)
MRRVEVWQARKKSTRRRAAWLCFVCARHAAQAMLCSQEAPNTQRNRGVVLLSHWTSPPCEEILHREVPAANTPAFSHAFLKAPLPFQLLTVCLTALLRGRSPGLHPKQSFEPTPQALLFWHGRHSRLEAPNAELARGLPCLFQARETRGNFSDAPAALCRDPQVLGLQTQPHVTSFLRSHSRAPEKTRSPTISASGAIPHATHKALPSGQCIFPLFDVGAQLLPNPIECWQLRPPDPSCGTATIFGGDLCNCRPKPLRECAHAVDCIHHTPSDCNQGHVVAKRIQKFFPALSSKCEPSNANNRMIRAVVIDDAAMSTFLLRPPTGAASSSPT